MSAYIAPNNSKIAIYEPGKCNDQVILSGVNEAYLVPKGVFMLEYFEAKATTTIILKDGKGNIIGSGVSAFSNDQSPLRCDYGIMIVGEVTMLKGFILRDVFSV